MVPSDTQTKDLTSLSDLPVGDADLRRRRPHSISSRMSNSHASRASYDEEMGGNESGYTHSYTEPENSDDDEDFERDNDNNRVLRVDPMEPRFTLPKEDAKGIRRHSEFALRYIPVVGTPEEFCEHYLLRSIEKKRRIKTLCVVTMYNEEPSELQRTLKGICRNVDHFVNKLGASSWKEFAVTIVADGRRFCHPKTLEYLENIGLFKQEHMDDALEASDDISLHLFESSIVLADAIANEHKPLQLMFALKEENGGKLDSHRWFFNAAAAQLKPKYTFLFDVGTKPERTAVFRLYEAMEKDKFIGGCCGEITTLSSANANPFVAAQAFEYKISTILDKSMESVFGFISVLPGAFSAYRFEAIEGSPLAKYFKQINTAPKDLGPFQGNMYLAEDRILCFEVLARKSRAWTLRYVKDARAATDVPEKLTSLIRQRRRWLNGSLFATVYVIANFGGFWKKSCHSVARKLFVSCLFLFYALSLILTWFLAANFYLMFHFASQGDDTGASEAIAFVVMKYLFWFLTLVQIVAGMGNKPQQMELMYFLCALGYGVFFFFTVGLSTQYVFSGDSDEISTIATLTTIGTYLISALLHGEILPVLGSMAQYFFMLPTFLIAFPIYSFCNIHDISWGTKGQDSVASLAAHAKNRKERELAEAELLRQRTEVRRTESRFKTFRTYLVISWVVTNAMFAVIITSLEASLTNYLRAMFIVFCSFNLFRLVFSIIYILQRWFRSCFRKCCCCCYKRKETT